MIIHSSNVLTPQGVRFSPTFAFYNPQGRKVDEVLGNDPQKLADHLWLHYA